MKASRRHAHLWTRNSNSNQNWQSTWFIVFSWILCKIFKIIHTADWSTSNWYYGKWENFLFFINLHFFKIWINMMDHFFLNTVKVFATYDKEWGSESKTWKLSLFFLKQHIRKKKSISGKKENEKYIVFFYQYYF